MYITEGQQGPQGKGYAKSIDGVGGSLVLPGRKPVVVGWSDDVTRRATVWKNGMVVLDENLSKGIGREINVGFRKKNRVIRLRFDW